ncbi:MAG: YqcI/YcgG family protein [Acidobacteria bacterium]|nr:YqcI/YcgG family protein [Acidobacteriota bacterium]
MESVRQLPNPFDSALALEQSNYCAFDGKRLVRQAGEPAPSNMTAFVHDGFRALTLNEHFTCVGGKAAVRQGGYRFGLYADLASAGSCAGLARDLFTFIQERDSFQTEFSTFVASFSGPLPPDEATFEDLLWTTLQQLHDLDAVYHGWDLQVAADTADPRFSFSFAERAFFVVGLHAASSRATRRFAWPTLIFNPHEQFDRLKKAGRYQRFQQIIRGAERALQGDINPMLANFGERSEASQYSGRQVGSDWRCPFQAKAESSDQASAKE